MNSDLTSDERALPAAAGAASTPHPVNKPRKYPFLFLHHPTVFP